MNMKKYIAMAAAALMFAACSNDDIPATGVDAMTDKPVLVNAAVAELVTRSGMSSDALATLSLTIENTANPKYSYSNVKYVGSGSAFAPEGDVQPLWQNGTQEVTVSAWSPYIEGDLSTGYAFTVPADQTSDDSSSAADFLWVSETVDPDGDQTGRKTTYRNDGSLAVALQHVMSKLVVNLRLGTEMDPAVAVSNVVVKGLENSCILDLAAFTVQAPANSVMKDIIAHAEQAKDGYNATFEAIFPPQNAEFTIMIELNDGRKFLYESGFDFESDHAYTVDLNVGKDKVELAGGEAGIVAAPWREDTEANKYLESE